MRDKIVPAGMPTIVPIETYGAMKKSPIHIPKSLVISMNIFGRKSNGTDCVSVFSSSAEAVRNSINNPRLQREAAGLHLDLRGGRAGSDCQGQWLVIPVA